VLAGGTLVWLFEHAWGWWKQHGGAAQPAPVPS